jgi:hypothetical protein
MISQLVHLNDSNHDECVFLINDTGLMLNMSLFFNKIAFNVSLLWSKLEVDIILACFEIFEFMPEAELVQFGFLNQILKSATKVIQIANYLENTQDVLAADCQDLTEILITCFNWLTNLARHDAGRKEIF